MKDLNIPGTQSTPAITADPARGLLTMRGDSYPENSFELFGPVIEWVESYLLGASAPLNLELELLYLNTSSIKSMMDIFDVLESAHGKAARLVSPGSTTCATSASANWPRNSRKTAPFPSRLSAANESRQRRPGPAHRRIVGGSRPCRASAARGIEALWRHTADQMARIERVTQLSDAYQTMAHEREIGLCDRFDRQLRRLTRIARISDHYQSMMRDLNAALEETSSRDP